MKTATQQARTNKLKAPAGFHESADGAFRCDHCHLTPDLCTCAPDHPLRQVAAAIGFAVPAACRN